MQTPDRLASDPICTTSSAMSIGFKEWAIVCDAISTGDQSVIIRKGGIHEGRDGFRFQHDAFYLFPTLFHEQVTQTTLPPDTPIPALPEGEVRIETFVRVESTKLISDLSTAFKLRPFHILRNSVVEDRFNYDEPQGVNVAVIRAYRLPEPWTFPMEKKFGGCRSWVTLPDPPPFQKMEPVLGDDVHAHRVEEICHLAEGVFTWCPLPQTGSSPSVPEKSRQA
jgi:hypothetical protein